MQTENRFFEDLSRMMNGLAGTMAGVGREAETNARDRVRDWLGGGGEQVSRDEFEAVKAMAAAARDEADALRARLDAIEARTAPAAVAAPASRPVAETVGAADRAAPAAVEAPGGDAAPGVPTL